MKFCFLILYVIIPISIYPQNSATYDSTIKFLREQGIKLNAVQPPSGFEVYYNCDSLLFLRGDFGDTIKIWTTALDWFQNLEQFKKTVKKEGFGITEFAKSIDSYGRIYVSTYHQTEFIYRNDSLFEIEDANPAESDAFTDLFNQYYFKKQMDEKTYRARVDSLRQLEEKAAVYTPKLIFAKNMFRTRKKATPPRKLNFAGDTIELENRWIANGKTCYVIRINNKTETGEKTTYSYAFDENMRFIYWEGCDSR